MDHLVVKGWSPARPQDSCRLAPITMSKVLIVDDQLTGRMVLEKLSSLLKGTSSIAAFACPYDGLESARNDSPDLALVDFKMPQMDGVKFTTEFRTIPSCAEVPLVIVTAVQDRRLLCEALEAGATDFLIKPVDHNEFRVRCGNMLTMREQQKLIQNRTLWLERQVREATREIETRERETLMRLAKAGEYRDEDTGDHVLRMSKYCLILAEGLGLSPEDCSCVELAAPMHDIGKIGVSDSILLAPRRLTPEEFKMVQAHTTIGYEILKGSPSHYLRAGAVIALSHHEHYDGSGYPAGLGGEDIPLFARIVSVADVYDALTSSRPYKKSWSIEETVMYLKDEKGRQFDPRCVDVFCQNLSRILEIQRRVSDSEIVQCSVPDGLQ